MPLLNGFYAEKNGYSFGFSKNPFTKQYTIGQIKPFEDSISKNSILGATVIEGLSFVGISVSGCESYSSFLDHRDEVVDLGYNEYQKGEKEEWVFNLYYIL
jgi:hypothetical protein